MAWLWLQNIICVFGFFGSFLIIAQFLQFSVKNVRLRSDRMFRNKCIVHYILYCGIQIIYRYFHMHF